MDHGSNFSGADHRLMKYKWMHENFAWAWYRLKSWLTVQILNKASLSTLFLHHSLTFTNKYILKMVNWRTSMMSSTYICFWVIVSWNTRAIWGKFLCSFIPSRKKSQGNITNALFENVIKGCRFRQLFHELLKFIITHQLALLLVTFTPTFAWSVQLFPNTKDEVHQLHYAIFYWVIPKCFGSKLFSFTKWIHHSRYRYCFNSNWFHLNC